MNFDSYTMNVDEIMTAFEIYEAEAAANLLMSSDDWWAMVDSMLVEMYNEEYNV